MATVEQLWVKRAHRGPMDTAASVELVAGRGIVGNADQGGWRPVTILSAARWARVGDDLGHEVDPVTRRANVLVDDLDLVGSRGRTLAVGADVRLLVTVETRPCRLMDMSVPGLQDALDADWGGGASARVLVGGTVQLGDAVEWVDEAPGANVHRSGAHSSVG